MILSYYAGLLSYEMPNCGHKQLIPLHRSESNSQFVQTASGLQQDAHMLSFRLRSAGWRLAADSQSLQWTVPMVLCFWSHQLCQVAANIFARCGVTPWKLSFSLPGVHAWEIRRLSATDKKYSMMALDHKGHLRTRRVRRNARRISTIAEGEQNWRRMLIWVRNENRLHLQFVQYGSCHKRETLCSATSQQIWRPCFRADKQKLTLIGWCFTCTVMRNRV